MYRSYFEEGISFEWNNMKDLDEQLASKMYSIT